MCVMSPVNSVYLGPSQTEAGDGVQLLWHPIGSCHLFQPPSRDDGRCRRSDVVDELRCDVFLDGWISRTVL